MNRSFKAPFIVFADYYRSLWYAFKRAKDLCAEYGAKVVLVVHQGRVIRVTSKVTHDELHKAYIA